MLRYFSFFKPRFVILPHFPALFHVLFITLLSLFQGSRSADDDECDSKASFCLDACSNDADLDACLEECLEECYLANKRSLG